MLSLTVTVVLQLELGFKNDNKEGSPIVILCLKNLKLPLAISYGRKENRNKASVCTSSGQEHNKEKPLRGLGNE